MANQSINQSITEQPELCLILSEINISNKFKYFLKGFSRFFSTFCWIFNLREKYFFYKNNRMSVCTRGLIWFSFTINLFIGLKKFILIWGRVPPPSQEKLQLEKNIPHPQTVKSTPRASKAACVIIQSVTFTERKGTLSPQNLKITFSCLLA